MCADRVAHDSSGHSYLKLVDRRCQGETEVRTIHELCDEQHFVLLDTGALQSKSYVMSGGMCMCRPQCAGRSQAAVVKGRLQPPCGGSAHLQQGWLAQGQRTWNCTMLLLCSVFRRPTSLPNSSREV